MSRGVGRSWSAEPRKIVMSSSCVFSLSSVHGMISQCVEIGIGEASIPNTYQSKKCSVSMSKISEINPTNGLFRILDYIADQIA